MNEHEPTERPNWDTKIACACGERCTNWMDFYRHRGDAYRAELATLRALASAVTEMTQGGTLDMRMGSVQRLVELVMDARLAASTPSAPECQTCNGSGLVAQSPGQPGDGYVECPDCAPPAADGGER